MTPQNRPLSNAVMRLAAPAPEHEATYTTIRQDLLKWKTTADERVAEHQNLKSPTGAGLLKAIHDEAQGRGRPETADRFPEDQRFRTTATSMTAVGFLLKPLRHSWGATNPARQPF
jgi:hypothetical protein